MTEALLKMHTPWGEFYIYLDEFGYLWFKEKDLCRNLRIPKYDDLPRWIKEDYENQSWCYEKEPCRRFEMSTVDLSEDWFWYEDFVWWVAKNMGVPGFAGFIENQFEESLEKFQEK